ncbi:galactocerebrosidase-like isoform X1 [Acanthaster planci]|uniref:galactosylceramidase n=1 Tax=Acanthaster planci TaxID=133434 RepID=A0A8B7XKZ9_ACAPL|nr:galactocerebrosidase-like isoform X1 [Acanthaster planci]
MSPLSATFCHFLLAFQLLYTGRYSEASQYTISDASGLGRRFDGIGGLSGGGATSRLLVNYPELYQSQILDYLFKPNFGASLPILKVEIGGDSQSTDGTESSHMHSPNDENYQRGYEWWLMKEAKKRNPKIKLYGLPWAFPGWIGNGTQSPYVNVDVTADYIIKWIQGAKTYHNLTIDYIGIWNERPFDVGYIKVLRKTLDKKGLTGMQIVAADNLEFISIAIHNDPEIAKDVAVIGVHYPGTYVTNYTLETGKTIWASEDYSTFNNEVGAGCWARILNQNYVNGMMTCTISWNLLASYYDALPYKRDGLMTANEPWSGHYEVPDTIWITAHTTQFTGPGWIYLKHNTGVQHLEKGGSFVSMTNGTDLTIIIETMSHNHSICIRPYLPPYSVVAQTATFALQGNFANISSLNVWYSKLGFSGETSTMFVKKNPIKIMNGHFSMNLAPDEVYTLTTTEGGIKGTYPAPPPSAPFPVPYSDNFDKYPQFTEANNFADQAGVWEIRETGDPTHHMVMEQVVLQSPVHWCQAADTPISVVGNYSWINANVSIDVKLGDKTGAFLAQRVDKGGCQVISATGLFFIVYFNGTFSVYTDINRRSLLSSGEVSVKSGMWFNMQLLTQNNKAAGFVEGKMVFSTPLDPQKVPSHGFVAIGMPNYASAQFDNFSITSAS